MIGLQDHYSKQLEHNRIVLGGVIKKDNYNNVIGVL